MDLVLIIILTAARCVNLYVALSQLTMRKGLICENYLGKALARGDKHPLAIALLTL